MRHELSEGLRALTLKKLGIISCSFFIVATLTRSFLSPNKSANPILKPKPLDAINLVPPPLSQSPASESVASPQPCYPSPVPLPPVPEVQLVPSGYVSACGNDTHAEARKLWLEADARYAHLMDDKFTIAIPTFRRPDVLNTTLTRLLRDKVPSLLEIVIIWNELDKTPPQGFVSKHGVNIRYRMSERNSLNMRLVPFAEYRTQAILQHDDDVWYEPGDLEFVFQTWRQLGRYRVTGALPRCYSRNDKGLLQYGQCREGQDWYALVLTNLAFVHISLMDYYSSTEPIPTLIREHVDEVFNCEDLAINYIASMLTCNGPLHVMGKDHYENQDPKGGISTSGTHMTRRHACLNYFEQVIGFFPLVHSMGSIQRGVPHFA
ncbi:glycosyl transferase family 64 domain-containing protein [Lasiosphaeria hispida]|uniref:Glycosyl transferase family 64 domain-containing protein n=1 Tax=Lasiosphaeria hispida TaxID=260671 RepID=A0AAJ0MFE0_9PEZI|nr:glycosyl transferase family 64 domain-containing protein [Lasiosphaeria hispida]